MYPEYLNEQGREKYCSDHELFLVKNAMGKFVCPFCESNLDL